MGGGEHYFQVSGTLSEDAPSYIDRGADRELLFHLERREVCMVLAPRQSGKSSLMVRASTALRAKGVHTALVDLQPLGSEENLDRWFVNVVYQIERGLGLATDSADWWEEHGAIGPAQRFIEFVTQVVVPETGGEVVLFFDEIDSVLSLPFSDDFFTCLRSLYNARASEPALKRITFVLLGVADSSSFIRDKSRTPFNIGHTIELKDFTPEAVNALCKVLRGTGQAVIDRIYHWTGGQPFLVQRLAATVYAWAEKERTVERLDTEIEEAFLKKRIEQDTHLKFIQDFLLADHPIRSGVLRLYGEILRGKQIAVDHSSRRQNRLKLAGVVKDDQKRLIPRNRIYEAVFDRKWVKKHTPLNIQRILTGVMGLALAAVLAWISMIQPRIEKARLELSYAQVKLERDEKEKARAESDANLQVALTQQDALRQASDQLKEQNEKDREQLRGLQQLLESLAVEAVGDGGGTTAEEKAEALRQAIAQMEARQAESERIQDALAQVQSEAAQYLDSEREMQGQVSSMKSTIDGQRTAITRLNREKAELEKQIAALKEAAPSPAESRITVAFDGVADGKEFDAAATALPIMVDSTAPLASVTLNGNALEIPAGALAPRLAPEVPLREGENRFTVAATDVNGKTASRDIRLIRKTAAPAAAIGDTAGRGAIVLYPPLESLPPNVQELLRQANNAAIFSRQWAFTSFQGDTSQSVAELLDKEPNRAALLGKSQGVAAALVAYKEAETKIDVSVYIIGLPGGEPLQGNNPAEAYGPLDDMKAQASLLARRIATLLQGAGK